MLGYVKVNGEAVKGGGRGGEWSGGTYVLGVEEGKSEQGT